MKYTQKLRTFSTTVQQTSGKTKTTSVYLNPSVAYKNTQILESFVKLGTSSISETNSNLRLINPVLDSARVAELLPDTTTSTRQVPGVSTVETDTRELVPTTRVPTQMPLSEEIVEALDEAVEEARSTEFVPFFDISPENIPLTIDPDTGPTSIVPGSFLNPGEESIFGSLSSIDVPVNLELAEQTTGLTLTKFEKPRVLAILNDDIRNGYPNKSVVIFKKLTSKRARVIKYTIYRKNVFSDNEFKKIVELQTDQLKIPAKYEQYINTVGVNKKDVFMYVDSNVRPNNTYVYKIEVTWASIGGPPQTEEDAIEFNPGVTLGLRLFMSGAL